MRSSSITMRSQAMRALPRVRSSFTESIVSDRAEASLVKTGGVEVEAVEVEAERTGHQSEDGNSGGSVDYLSIRGFKGKIVH